MPACQLDKKKTPPVGMARTVATVFVCLFFVFSASIIYSRTVVSTSAAASTTTTKKPLSRRKEKLLLLFSSITKEAKVFGRRRLFVT